MNKNEIIITQSEITLKTINGVDFVIGKHYYDIVKKAIAKSKSLYKQDKHNVIQYDLDSWNI